MVSPSAESGVQERELSDDIGGPPSQFCPACGTYVRMFRPARGRWRRVCPRCHPERMIEKKSQRDYIDKTGMPCKDRGKCRPERCVKALDCEEMAR